MRGVCFTARKRTLEPSHLMEKSTLRGTIPFDFHYLVGKNGRMMRVFMVFARQHVFIRILCDSLLLNVVDVT